MRVVSGPIFREDFNSGIKTSFFLVLTAVFLYFYIGVEYVDVG